MSAYPLYFEGERSGRLDVERDGLRYLITARCPRVGDGVYRAYAKAGGLGGVSLLIGAMQPEENEFVVRRHFTRAELANSGILADFIDCGVAAASVGVEPTPQSPAQEQHPDGWQPAENPDALVSDQPLKDCLKDARDVLFKESDGCVYIAAPIAAGKPFALCPAFSIARIVRIGDKSFGMVKIDNLGIPCIIG